MLLRPLDRPQEHRAPGAEPAALAAPADAREREVADPEAQAIAGLRARRAILDDPAARRRHERSVHAEPIELDLERDGRRACRRRERTQPCHEALDPCDLDVERDVADDTVRKEPGAADEGRDVRARDVVAAEAHQLLAEPVRVERAQRERLPRLDLAARGLESDAEALAQEETGRVPVELHEVVEGERPPRGIGLADRPDDERRFRFDARRLHATRGAEVVGVAEQPVVPLEVARIERLQRVCAPDVDAEALLYVALEIGDEHRRLALAAVARVEARVARVEHAARRQNRLEEEVAVVLAPRAVAGARLLRHQVEAERPARARIAAVIHTEQADHLERDRPHRHERAERDLAGEKPPGRERCRQGAFEVHADDVARQWRREAGSPRRFLERAQGAPDRRDVLLVVARRVEETLEDGAERDDPLGRRSHRAQLVAEREARLGERREEPGRARARALDIVVRQHAGEPPPPLPRHRIAEQQAIEAEAPRVLVRLGQPERGTAGAVDAPADPGLAHPPVRTRDVGVGEAEAAADRVDVEERQQAVRVVPALG